MKIKRQYIYAVLFISVVIPLATGLTFKVRPGPPVKKFYSAVNGLNEGDYAAVTLSYDPSTKAELNPMVIALCGHLFSRDVKIIMMNPLNNSIGNLGYELITRAASLYGKKENDDYYFLGYVPGEKSALQNMGEDFYSVYSKTFMKAELKDLPLYRDIKTIADAKMLIDISDGNSTVDLLTYVNTKYGVPMAAGTTAIMAGEYYTYLNSGQLLGMLGGLRGAAEYETMLGVNGKGRRGMAAQTFAHILVLLLVLAGNIEYFSGRRK